MSLAGLNLQGHADSCAENCVNILRFCMAPVENNSLVKFDLDLFREWTDCPIENLSRCESQFEEGKAWAIRPEGNSLMLVSVNGKKISVNQRPKSQCEKKYEECINKCRKR